MRKFVTAPTNLEEQHEWHPLIVAVVTLLLSIFIAQTMRCNIGTNLTVLLARYGECVRNPTECVDDMHWYGAIIDTCDGIALKRERICYFLNDLSYEIVSKLIGL